MVQIQDWPFYLAFHISCQSKNIHTPIYIYIYVYRFIFEFQIIAVELNRGWNSRLGFSLQYNPDTKQTFISAIYNDSVAAKDGRLCVGDQILRVST